MAFYPSLIITLTTQKEYHMSYSFNVRAKTRNELIAAINAKFDEIIANGQPKHETDKSVATRLAYEQSSLLRDASEGETYSASLSGYLSWTDDKEGNSHFSQISVNCQVAIINDPVEDGNRSYGTQQTHS